MRSRGVGDILIAVVDGLKGFPRAINAVFPQTVVQTCIVHLIRRPQVRRAGAARDLPGQGRRSGMKALEDFEASY